MPNKPAPKTPPKGTPTPAAKVVPRGQAIRRSPQQLQAWADTVDLSANLPDAGADWKASAPREVREILEAKPQ